MVHMVMVQVMVQVVVPDMVSMVQVDGSRYGSSYGLGYVGFTVQVLVQVAVTDMVQVIEDMIQDRYGFLILNCITVFTMVYKYQNYMWIVLEELLSINIKTQVLSQLLLQNEMLS